MSATAEDTASEGKMNKEWKYLQGYENTPYVHFDEAATLPNTVTYDELPNRSVTGVLKANQYVNGKLTQTYTEHENHVGVIAATRLDKTTSYVIPTILSFARQKQKRSMIISDPKGEIYRYTAAALKKEGYNVKLLNFRDYRCSECWNILTPIYRKYIGIREIPNEPVVVETKNGLRNRFRGRIYDDQAMLDREIKHLQTVLTEEVANDIDNVAKMFVTTENTRDPYWEDSSRDLLKAFFWAMLEDTDENCPGRITEDTFSFSTIFTIMSGFREEGRNRYDDQGYFSSRNTASRAYLLAKSITLENGDSTRKCILAIFNTKISVFRESTVNLITRCNSFEMSELIGGPVAVFIDYHDELKTHYQLISLFVQDAYRRLIEETEQKENKKLDVPFYFVLDEFGNFPAIPDFETTISACAGRNIFFILIIQSYAQLDCVYGKDVATIIRDNLNVHVFFGSNNPSTLEEFSNECGLRTRLSPMSVLNGKGVEIENYQIETIPLVPKSALSHIQPGECIVTEANCGYVMYSKLERYYACMEFQNLELSSEKDYVAKVNPFDERYLYKYIPRKKNPYEDDDWL